MTSIEYLSISGFKRIQNLDIEPGQINIVTGRNNTGKTTLLESIDFLFNTQDPGRYGNNIEYMINVHSDRASLECKFRKEQQLTIQSFRDSDSSNQSSRSVKIRQPNRSEAIKLLMNGVMAIVETGPDSNYFIDRFMGREFDLEEYDISKESIEKSIEEGITNLPEGVIYEAIDGSAVVITVGEKDYPYVYFGQFYQSLSNQIAEQAVGEFYNLPTTPPKIDENVPKELLDRMFSDLLVPRFGRGRFVYEDPPRESGVKFVDSIMVSQEDVETDDAAVRVSRIEDYLLEHNLVDNLADFSFGDIVFEEKGEKHQVPYSFMGDGFKSVVGLLWALSDQKSTGNILLLEEPETHMHPGYINTMVHYLINLAMESKLQFFITTHDMDFIRGFFSNAVVGHQEEFLMSEFQLFQMEGDTTQSISYAEARERMNELQLDLRGI